MDSPDAHACRSDGVSLESATLRFTPRGVSLLSAARHFTTITTRLSFQGLGNWREAPNIQSEHALVSGYTFSFGRRYTRPGVVLAATGVFLSPQM
jgi:hypothetical protein